MQDTPFSFKDIVGIIKVCGQNHVSQLKLGTLEVTFHPWLQSDEARQSQQIHIINRQVDPSLARSVITGGEEFPAQTDEEIQKQLEEFKKEQDLINDPEAHEEDAIEEAIRE
jgi:hypothetical protein